MNFDFAFHLFILNAFLFSQPRILTFASNQFSKRVENDSLMLHEHFDFPLENSSTGFFFKTVKVNGDAMSIVKVLSFTHQFDQIHHVLQDKRQNVRAEKMIA